MDAQIWWRFACYQKYPFKLTEMADPTSDPMACSQAFWDTPACCKKDAFCLKVMDLFPDATASAEDKEMKLVLKT